MPAPFFCIHTLLLETVETELETTCLMIVTDVGRNSYMQNRYVTILRLWFLVTQPLCDKRTQGVFVLLHYRRTARLFCYGVFLHGIPPGSASILFLFRGLTAPHQGSQNGPKTLNSRPKGPLILDSVIAKNV